MNALNPWLLRCGATPTKRRGSPLANGDSFDHGRRNHGADILYLRTGGDGAALNEGS
jgi:hypothetical protein